MLQVGRPLDSTLVVMPHPADPSQLLPLATLRQMHAAAAAAAPAAAPAPAKTPGRRGRPSAAARAQQQAAAAAAAAAAATSGPSPAAAAAAASGPAIPNDFVVGSPTHGEEGVARMRVTAAQCLGVLCSVAHAHGSPHAAQELLACLASPSATARQLGALAAGFWLQHAKQQLAPTPAPAPNSTATPPGASDGGASTPIPDPSGPDASPPPPSAPSAHPSAPTSDGSPVAVQLPPQLQLPQPLLLQIFTALSASSSSAPHAPASAEPYAETLPYYAQMRREVLALVSAAMEVNVLLPLPAGVPVDAMGADQAAALLAAAASAAPPEGSPLALACVRLRNALASLQVRAWRRPAKSFVHVWHDLDRVDEYH